MGLANDFFLFTVSWKTTLKQFLSNTHIEIGNLILVKIDYFAIFETKLESLTSIRIQTLSLEENKK